MKDKKLHPKVIQYLKEGMLFGDGMKIEITYRKGDKVWNNRELFTDKEIEVVQTKELVVEKIKMMIYELFKEIFS